MIVSPHRLASAFTALLLAGWLAVAPPTARAQETDRSPRFGLGMQALLSTVDGVGTGLRVRASTPVNADLSAAVDMGLTGFVLGGADDAVYLFEPQVSAVVNLPVRSERPPYLLAGLGGHIPLGSNASTSESGVVLHVGAGRVQALMDTSLFYEINPGLLIGDERVQLLLPVRIGIIFR